MAGWDRDSAAHLLRRAGFGAPARDVERAVGDGRDATIERLLRFRPSRAVFRKKDGFYDSQAWWLRRMLRSPAQLQEKLALFWHGHFATAYQKVDDVRLMGAQNRTFRNLGARRFRDLLLAVAQDPAMIWWLDGAENVKDHPNENFARELLELFTLGIVDDDGGPNYTETDVREAARAFTGWTLGNRYAFTFDAGQHDDGVKTVLGVTGALTGEQVCDIAATHPQCARWLARRLWTFFAYPDPERAVVDALAQVYVSSDTDISAVLRTLFSRDEFYSERARSERVASPVEFAVGTLRTLGARTNGRELADATARMGQEIYNPPNVAGWPGGLAWMTSVTRLARYEFAWRVATARYGERAMSVTPARLTRGLADDASVDEVVDHVLRIAGVSSVPGSARDALVEYATTGPEGERAPLDLRDERTVDVKVRGLLGIALTLPEAQLA